MKPLKISLILSIIVLFSSCMTDSTTDNIEQIVDNKTSITIQDFSKSFEGTINTKIGVVMLLTKKDNNLSGTYSYISQGIPMKISGVIDDEGNLTINEFNNTGSMTGVFKGQLNSNTISGVWSKPDGSKEMPFSMSQSTNKESIVKNSESDNSNDYSNWTGTYIDEFGKTLTVKGPASDGALRFDLQQGGETCTGQVEGTAYLTKKYVANYSENNGDCHITFTFNPGSIQVSDYDCQDYHGASCGEFSGWYNKK